MKISVIVCTFNGEKTLEKTLHALQNQTYKDFETIIVDDGSTDKTAAIAEKFPVKLICNKKNIGLSASRNVGIKESKGEIVAFTDDDCIPDSQWLKVLMEGYRVHSAATGIGGSIIVANTDKSLITAYLKENNPLQPLSFELTKSNNVLYRLFLYVKNLHKPFIQRPEEKVYMIIGANMSFRKSVFKEVGLFDETFTFGADEEDFCKRIFEKKAGELWYIPPAVIKHTFETTLLSFYRKQSLYGKGNARMVAKYKNQNPTIFPFPTLVTLCFFIGFWHWQFFIIAFLLPFFFYPRGILLAVATQKISSLTFPYIQLIGEQANDIGFIQGWFVYRKVYS